MKKQQLKKGAIDIAPRTIENNFYPDIDSTYTTMTYSGDRLKINTSEHTLGIKTWSNTPANMQGMAIYENLLVRMANTSSSTTHYIYTISTSGALIEVATFTLSTTGHSNTLQFAPTVESGQTYPYLYVSDLNGGCEVLSIAADYTVTQVQKITIPTGWQVQIGDDGFLWAIYGGGNTPMQFIKYRKVSVTEGDVTLTSEDIIERITSTEYFDPSLYTFQGSKFKFGQAWLPIGTTGTSQKRALFVFDLAQGRTAARIDLTDIGNVEFEDLDFWNDSLILCCYSSTNYILKF